MDGIEKEKKASSGRAIRVYPSEIGSWEYCCLKWYFEYKVKNSARREKEGGAVK